MTLGKRIDPADSMLNWETKKGEGKANHKPTSLPNSTSGEPNLNKSPFQPRKPRYRFDQLILPKHVRRQLDILDSRIKNHHLLYDEWDLKSIDPYGARIAFNLYGPPGTGKTMCVEAIAHQLNKDIIDVSYAEIESKFVGDTGKNIVAAFSSAIEHNALLFFDEADSILGKRMTSVTQAADHGVNVARAVMLKQLDEFDGIVAFATNLAKNFDAAFVRRIPQHIEIPLPDLEGRKALWKKMIGLKIPGRETVDMTLLAIESKGLSGGDIRNAVVNALANVAGKDAKVAFTADFTASIKEVAKAKKDVGSPTTTKKTFEEPLEQ